MATKEAIMIRIEKAHERIKDALSRLQAETGAEISEITLIEKDSLSRQAELSEKLATNLEALCRIIVPELDVDDDEIPFELHDGDSDDEYTGIDDPLAPITLDDIAKSKVKDTPNAEHDKGTTGGAAGKPSKKPTK